MSIKSLALASTIIAPLVFAHDAQARQATSDDTAVEGVVVTGSRIARPELESAMPISVTTMEQARDFARVTVYDALMQNPAMGPGLGESSSLGQEYDAGVANINLRNMGNNRSLVLVDGHRWVSGGARTSAVDVNTIPTALIDRFEVVTGGAAAVYGADAVTGAVNVVMKKAMKGVQLSATTGVSSHTDARQSDFTAATGFDFAEGRGHVVVGGNISTTDKLRSTERWINRDVYSANPANTGPNDGIPDRLLYRDYRIMYRSIVPTWCVFGGKNPCGNNNGQWYQYVDGKVVAVPQDSYRIVTNGETGGQNGGPGLNGNENHFIRNGSNRQSIYSNVNYAFTDDLVWNGTFSLTRSKTRGAGEFPEYRTDARTAKTWWGKDGVGNTGEIATLTNPFLPAAMRDYMLASGLTQLGLDRSYNNLPQTMELHDRRNILIGSDISGKLTRRLDWTAFARYGRVDDDWTTTNMVGRDQWLFARDSVRDASGAIVCRDPAARAAGCKPLDFFTTGPLDPGVLDYILFDRFEKTRNAMLNAGASVDGSLFELPAGAVKTSLGVEWRRETLDTWDDPDKAKLSTIVFAPGNDFVLHPDFHHKRETAEAFAELVVPVLADLPFARRLQVEGAYRYSDYSDNDSTNTWKVGMTWSPVRDLTFRGTRSHSVRVPNFGELYTPISFSIYGKIDDPCSSAYIGLKPNRAANCAATVPGVKFPVPYPNLNVPIVYGGGNPDLEPETSNSLTYGVVFQPRFLRNFDLTVDYWDIKVDNVITSLAYTTLMNNCVDASGGPDQAYCQYVIRNPAGARDTDGTLIEGSVKEVRTQFANLAGQRVRGIDLAARYRARVGSGLLRLTFAGARLLEQTTISERGKAGIDYSNQWNYPRYRATLTTSYDIGRFTIGLNNRYVSKSKYAVNSSDEYNEFPNVRAFLYKDLNITWRARKGFDIALGVKNLDDYGVPPAIQDTAISPHGAGDGRNIGPAYYDAIGRYFFLKLDARF